MPEPKSANLTFCSRIDQPAKNRRDVTGQRFGDWVVTCRDGSNGHDSSWFARNDVTGETKSMYLPRLREIARQSKARAELDIIGKTFGQWRVVKTLEPGHFECEGDGVVVRLRYRQLLAFEREWQRRARRAEAKRGTAT